MANELFIAGEEPTAAKLNRIVGAGGFTAYVPTLTQSGAVTKNVEYASYSRSADRVEVIYSLAITGAGTAANQVRVGMPAAVPPAPFRVLGGQFGVFDASVGLWYFGAPMWQSAGIVIGQPSGVGSALGQAVFTAALAAGDVVAGAVWYNTSS